MSAPEGENLENQQEAEKPQEAEEDAKLQEDAKLEKDEKLQGDFKTDELIDKDQADLLEAIAAQNALCEDLLRQANATCNPKIINTHKKELEKLEFMLKKAIIMQNKKGQANLWPPLPMGLTLSEQHITRRKEPNAVIDSVRELIKSDGSLMKKCLGEAESEEDASDQKEIPEVRDPMDILRQLEEENVLMGDCKERDGKSNAGCSTNEDSEICSQILEDRENIIRKLQCRIACMENELCNIQKQRLELKNMRLSAPPVHQMKRASPSINLELKQKRLSAATYPQLERQSAPKKRRSQIICTEKPSLSENEKLRKRYVNLLMQYDKMATELKELRANCKNSGNGNDKKINRAENEICQGKLIEAQNEIEEFKCILKEQEEQLEDYRKKYLKALQTIEEQECMLKLMECNNKKLEDQVNLEVKRVRYKFQSKLDELSSFPKLLEEEHLKLTECCQENDLLKRKLCLVCKELKATKQQICCMLAKEETDRRNENHVIEEEDCGMVQVEKDLLAKELAKAEEDLSKLRAETGAILARCKENSECIQNKLKKRICQLEEELASSRAQACCNTMKCDEKLKELRDKLQQICCNFEIAEAEIRTLRNLVKYLKKQLASRCTKIVNVC